MNTIAIIGADGVSGGGVSADAGATRDPLPLEVLGARICAAASRMASATCAWLEMVGEFDAREGWAGVGIRSCAHWLAWTCSESPGAAREHVRVARAMRSLPLARAEFAAGRLSYSKMREITRVADRVDDVTLVDLALTATASQLARAIRGMRRSDEDALTHQARRRVDWYTDPDGMFRLRAALPPEEGALILAAIRAASQHLAAAPTPVANDHRAGSSTDGGREEPVSGPRISHADALICIATGYLAGAPSDNSGEDRTTVILHVDSTLLTGPASILAPTQQPAASVDQSAAQPQQPAAQIDQPLPRVGQREHAAPPDRTAIPGQNCCQVAGVAGVSRDTAERLACDAMVIAMVRGAGGAVLGHGRRRRLVSPAQRRALMVRDGHCQFPSCERTTHLEIHHVRHWAAGGPTELDNLVALCHFHHVACHEGGVAIVPAAGALPGVPRWAYQAVDGTQLSADRIRERFRRDDDFLSWCALLRTRSSDGAAGWRDPRAEAIRPGWAGEPFQLPEVVAALLGNPKVPDSWPQAA